MSSPFAKKKGESVLNQPPVYRYIRFFMLFFYGCFVINLVFAFLSNGESFAATLFGDFQATDLYMDFFNTIRDAGNSNVYTERNNIYPPLCLLFFKFLGYFVDRRLVELKGRQRLLLQIDQRCMMLYVLYAIVCMLVIMRILNAYLTTLELDKRLRLHGKFLSFFMLVSYPTIYCIERGNVIMLSFIATAFFVFFYRSANKFLRELSLICLAVAAGIKLYPAIFGILLLLDKKYKMAIRAIVYGILAIALPAVVFLRPGAVATASIVPGAVGAAAAAADGGVVRNLIQNILKFAFEKKSTLNFSSVSVENFVFLADPFAIAPAKVLCVITEAIAAVTLIFAKKRWQQVLLVCYLMLNIPAASSSYSLTFLIIPFFIFLFEEKPSGKLDAFFHTVFTLILVPLPTLWYFQTDTVVDFMTNTLGINYNSKANQLVSGFLFQAMFVAIVIFVFICFAQSKKAAKQKKATAPLEESEQYELAAS